MVEQSIKSLMNFGNNAKPQDDITLLGLEFKRLG
jgi:serine phosphatase RsbU (regulator of sigma subunit)